MKFNRNLFWNPTAETSGNGTAAAAPVVLVLTNLTYQAVVDMKPEQQDAMMKKFSTRVTSLKETQKDVKTESKYAAVLLAGVEERVNRGIKAGVYASTFTVSDLYKQITGEKPPGHVYTLKCAYVTYVLSGKITEADYLGNRNNCLELAQKIADAVIELNLVEGLQHDAVTRAAAELKTRNENEAKVLRGILASVKPAKVMTAEEALEMIAEIFSAGHFSMCTRHIVTDLVKNAPEQIQKETVITLTNSALDIEKFVGADKMNAWMADTTEVVNAGPELITGTPETAPAAPEITPEPAPETPATAPEETPAEAPAPEQPESRKQRRAREMAMAQ